MSRKPTASFAQLWPVPVEVTVRAKRPKAYPPADAHPITRDAAALERAIVTILESAKTLAAAAGTLPEDDVEAEAFRRLHGRLAATIRNPIQELHADGLDLLVAHARLSLPPSQFDAMAERLMARSDRLSRYAADTRPRH